MQLAAHLAALRAWCKQSLAGRLEPDAPRPDIVGMRGSYGHTTTVTYDDEHTSIPPPYDALRVCDPLLLQPAAWRTRSMVETSRFHFMVLSSTLPLSAIRPHVRVRARSSGTI